MWHQQLQWSFARRTYSCRLAMLMLFSITLHLSATAQRQRSAEGCGLNPPGLLADTVPRTCNATCRADTLGALESIYKQLHGDQWNFDISNKTQNGGDWMSCHPPDRPICTTDAVYHEGGSNQPLPAYCCWQGVNCCHEHSIYNDSANNPCNRYSVAVLQLRAAQIKGNIANIWQPLQTLHTYGLVVLDMSRNELNGTLPADLDKLANLQALLLGANNLSGSVPPSVGNLANLQQLDLEFNFFRGNLMPGQLCPPGSPLSNLLLRANDFTGPIDLSGCGNLTVVDLQDNGFSGRLPVGATNRLLHVFRARNNYFNGSIPAALWELPQLITVDLTNNSLSGMLAETVASTNFLTNLYLGSNNLTGTIPLGLTTSSQLTVLDLSNNAWIVGTMPSMRWMLGLQQLDLSNTRIRGRIPNELGLLPFLMSVDIRNTLMTCCTNFTEAEAANKNNTLLPDFLAFNSQNMRSPVDERMPNDLFLRQLMATGENLLCESVMRTPNSNPGNDTVHRPANLTTQQWALDPEYYWFFKCKCQSNDYESSWNGTVVAGLWCESEANYTKYLPQQVANVTHECRNLSVKVCKLRAPRSLSAWQYALISIAALCVLCLLVMLASLTLSLCIARTGKVRRQLDWWTKHLSGMPKTGKMSIVVTDIEGYSDLFKRCPEPMYQALTLHNNVIRRAKYTNCGSTVQQEGDSYTLVFHDAMDAVAFCLQAQLALMEVSWPEGLHEAEGSNSGHRPDKAGMKSARSKGRKLSQLDSSWKAGGVSSLLLAAGPSTWLRKQKLSMKQTGSTASSTAAALQPPSPTTSETLAMSPVIGGDAGGAQAASSSLAMRSGHNLSGARMLELFSRAAAGGSGGVAEAALFNGLRVRMGVVTGVVEGPAEPVSPAANIMNSALYKLALDVSDAGNGGQVLMDETTFSKVKEDLRPLGAVGSNGINYNKLAQRMSLFHLLCLGSLFSRRSTMLDVDEALVLDMGQFELPAAAERKQPAPPNLAGMMFRASMKMVSWGAHSPTTTAADAAAAAAATAAAAEGPVDRRCPTAVRLPPQRPHHRHNSSLADGEWYTAMAAASSLPGAMPHTWLPGGGADTAQISPRIHGTPMTASPMPQGSSVTGSPVAGQPGSKGSTAAEADAASSEATAAGTGRATDVAGWSGPAAGAAAATSGGGASGGGLGVLRKRVRLVQILPPSLVGRAHVWGNKLAIRSMWICVDAPYFEAPGALEAPLSMMDSRLTYNSLGGGAQSGHMGLTTALSVTPGSTSFVSVTGCLPLPPSATQEQQQQRQQQPEHGPVALEPAASPLQVQQQQQQEQPSGGLDSTAVAAAAAAAHATVSAEGTAATAVAVATPPGQTIAASVGSRGMLTCPSIKEETPSSSASKQQQQQQQVLVSCDTGSSSQVNHQTAAAPAAATLAVAAAAAAAAAAGLFRQPIPPVTMVFMIVDGAKALAQRRKQLVKDVHGQLSLMLMEALKHVTGGYMCRMQEGDLKYMVAFASARSALEWCLIVQEAALYLNWPPSWNKVPQLRTEYDVDGQLVFRGPRLKMGVCEGVPQSIIPNHEGRADYHGSSINQAARFMDAAAHGGQIACELDLARAVVRQWSGTDSSSNQPTADQPDAAVGELNLRAGSSSSSQQPADQPDAAVGELGTLRVNSRGSSSDAELQQQATEGMRASSAPELPCSISGPEVKASGTDVSCAAASGSGAATMAAAASQSLSLDSSIHQQQGMQTATESSQAEAGEPDKLMQQSPFLTAASTTEPSAAVAAAGATATPAARPASRGSRLFGHRPSEPGSSSEGSSTLKLTRLFHKSTSNGAGRNSHAASAGTSAKEELHPPEPTATAAGDQPTRLFGLPDVATAPVGVEVHALGTFKFKGSPQPLEMVNVTLTALSGRLPLLPTDPPKGKGARIAAKQGLVASCQAVLPVLAQEYRSCVPQHILEYPDHAVAGSWGAAGSSPVKRTAAGLRSASMPPARSFSPVQYGGTRSPSPSPPWLQQQQLPGQQQQHGQQRDLQLAALGQGGNGSSSSNKQPVRPPPLYPGPSSSSGSFTARLFKSKMAQNGNWWPPDAAAGGGSSGSNGSYNGRSTFPLGRSVSAFYQQGSASSAGHGLDALPVTVHGAAGAAAGKGGLQNGDAVLQVGCLPPPAAADAVSVEMPSFAAAADGGGSSTGPSAV